MQIKRHNSWVEATNYNFGTEGSVSLCKRHRFPIKRQPAIKRTSAMADRINFNLTQTEQMMYTVLEELQNRITSMKREVVDLEWAKNLRADMAYDTRIEYLAQLEKFWDEQEASVSTKISVLMEDIQYWQDQLEYLKSRNFNIKKLIEIFETHAIDLLEQASHLQEMLIFLKNDTGSLKEALSNISSLSIQGPNSNPDDLSNYHIRKIDQLW